ncbi:MAG: DinB family protein [Janthinobacterium lividum]
MRKIMLYTVLLLSSAAALPTFAQGTAQVSPAKTYDEMLSGFESELTGVAKAMPADKYNFAPGSLNISGAKYDGVYTFAGEVKHLISANYYFYGVVGGIKPAADMKAIQAMTAKDDLVKALADSFAFAHKAVATLTPANAFDEIKPVDGITSRGALAAFGVAHGFDHYGQMVEYLRMNGIVPPGSK